MTEKSEEVIALLEVLREAMGETDLEDDALLEFARSTEFKEFFPDLASEIPLLESILNADSGKKISPEKKEQVPTKPTELKKPENPPRSKSIYISDDDSVVYLTNDNDNISKTGVSGKSSTSFSKHTENNSKLKEKEQDKDKNSEGDTHSTSNKGEKSEKDKERKNSTESHIKREHNDDYQKREREEKSIASTSASAIKKEKGNYKPLTKIPRRAKEWKPFLDHEYQKYRKKYRLETNSVIICDLQSFKSVFHGAGGVDPSAPLFSSTVQLKHHMVIAPEKVRMIRGIESTKRYTAAKDLNKMLAIKQKERRLQEQKKAVPVVSSSSESDDEAYKNMINARKKQLEAERERRRKRKSMSSDEDNSSKKKKKNRRRLASSSSDSDCVATKKSKPAAKEEKPKKPLNKKPRSEKKIKPEEVKIPPHMKWEKKAEYFVQERDDKEQERKKDESRKIVPIAHLLANVEKEQAKVRRTAKDVPSSVPLCVPKLSAAKLALHSTAPQTTYYLSDISTEVQKLLGTDTVIEMPSNADSKHLYDTTVRKIVWWFLKCEQDPAPNEKIHPELHDEVYELDGYESDTSSVGHVSDPEGIHKPVFDPKAIIDPDKKDEFCGLHSIDAQIRAIAQGPPYDTFSNCFKVKPGTNYDRATFTIKCHICDLIIRGSRGLGAHIRDGAHANNFRNRSLSLAAYQELVEECPHEKIYVATLKDYGKGEDCQADLPEYLLKSLNKTSTLVSSSKAPVLDESSTFFDIQEDPKLIELKRELEKRGGWSYHLNKKWLEALEEEKKMVAEYMEAREKYKKNPSSHPKYEHEWGEFWYNRYDELEAMGENADNHNFEAEWNPIKASRILTIFKQETDENITTMRAKIRMDCDSLARLVASLPPPRKIEKKPNSKPLLPPQTPQSVRPSPPPPPKVDIPKRPPSPPKLSGPRKPPSPPRISDLIKNRSEQNDMGKEVEKSQEERKELNRGSRQRSRSRDRNKPRSRSRERRSHERRKSDNRDRSRSRERKRSRSLERRRSDNRDRSHSRDRHRRHKDNSHSPSKIRVDSSREKSQPQHNRAGPASSKRKMEEDSKSSWSQEDDNKSLLAYQLKSNNVEDCQEVSPKSVNSMQSSKKESMSAIDSPSVISKVSSASFHPETTKVTSFFARQIPGLAELGSNVAVIAPVAQKNSRTDTSNPLDNFQEMAQKAYSSMQGGTGADDAYDPMDLDLEDGEIGIKPPGMDDDLSNVDSPPTPPPGYQPPPPPKEPPPPVPPPPADPPSPNIRKRHEGRPIHLSRQTPIIPTEPKHDSSSFYPSSSDTSRSLLPNPREQGGHSGHTAVRGRGWTHSYRGGSSAQGSVNVNVNVNIPSYGPQSIQNHSGTTNSPFRGRIQRGSPSSRGGNFRGQRGGMTPTYPQNAPSYHPDDPYNSQPSPFQVGQGNSYNYGGHHQQQEMSQYPQEGMYSYNQPNVNVNLTTYPQNNAYPPNNYYPPDQQW